ncbi:hypothetical protein I5Q34_25985 [Streptomyces sp. AV19]|uniref:MoaF-related domain-containing protein n=1 Tax=Streptomyces sp. AV19 TaxID=2793068 RepID=UPI0018FE40F8|nr:hypothetical protein [Streptomyces sp. AV19]MBH1937680.1 hypothetical protein [Streptomyces sp. AV19]MDG4536347.1 hypothetical protein [Streptomyces sp. AV19]
MKPSRFVCLSAPLALAVFTAGAPAVEAETPTASHHEPHGSGCHEEGRASYYKDAAVPALGQTWTVDFGPDNPIGPGTFAATITFDSRTKATIKVTQGPANLKGLTQDITYTSTRLRPCQYAVTWHEPKTGVYATQVEDYGAHRVYDSLVDGTKMMHMTGTFYRTR